MAAIIIPEEVLKQKITESLPKILDDILGSTYSSPLRDVVKEELEAQQGTIRKLINEVIVQALGDTKFKEQLGQIVLTKIVEKGLH